MDASAELVRLIHAVLDGEASAHEIAELERLMAADPAVRHEFATWRAMFGALHEWPQAHPPEGLVAAVTAAVAAVPVPVPRRSLPARLFATHRRTKPPDSTMEAFQMSETRKPGRSTRKMWIGGGLVVVAAVISIVAFDYPPQAAGVLGTIMPAERYRAPQSGAEAIKLGDQTIAQLMQTDAFDRAVKDPQLKALAQDANMRLLAQLLAKTPEASLAMLQNVEAAKAAAENTAQAQLLLANVALSQQVMSELAAKQTVAEHANLANAIMQKMDASQAILANVNAASYALLYPQAALAIAANAEASHMLMQTSVANMSMLSSAMAQSMAQNAAANATLLQSAQAQAERNSQAGQ